MTIRRMWIGTIAALALAATGCAQTDTQDDSAALSGAHEMHGPPGPQLLLSAALQHLDLTAEQRTAIENAQHAIAPGAAVHQAMLADVAAGVRAGHLDEAALLAKLDGGGTDMTTSVAKALDTLHATLTAEQRRALVDLITKHMDEHKMAHAAQHAGPDAMIEHLLSGLDLSSDQRATIDAIVAKPGSEPAAASADSVHAELAAHLQAFAADRFDSAAFAATCPSSSAMHDHVQAAIHTLGEILPVLTPAQREALAARIEAMSMHGD
jgi:Spy/CpxP family protein refolding chaperone